MYFYGRIIFFMYHLYFVRRRKRREKIFYTLSDCLQNIMKLFSWCTMHRQTPNTYYNKVNLFNIFIDLFET